MTPKLSRISRWFLSIGILTLPLIAILGSSSPVSADGGPIVDPLLFAHLKEGQQTALVRIVDAQTAQIDLFVSILDQTGQSHDITYFVPLGINPNGFGAVEQTSVDYDSHFTKEPDMGLLSGSLSSDNIVHGLFAGALLGNGAILAPLWYPIFFSGCESSQGPLATFSTPSSTVSVFDINETTDIQALVSATGLDPSVIETLNSLQGQQIAVVAMKTIGQSATGSSTSGTDQGEPGLHLSWSASLTAGKSGSSVYTYPLGTGAAWSQPIDLTRVYIVAPMDFSLSVNYPKLGTNLSGYVRKNSTRIPRILQAGDKPAYAVQRAYGVFLSPYNDIASGTVARGVNMNIWRISYANSNAKDNIQITVKQGVLAGLGDWLRQGNIFSSFFVGLAAAAIFWLLSWNILMPRLLHHSIKDRWYEPLIYLGVNLVLLVFPGLILLLAMSLGAEAAALIISAIIFGGIGILIFALAHMNRLGVSRWVAVRSFIIVTLASNAAYLLFALGYAKVAGVI